MQILVTDHLLFLMLDTPLVVRSLISPLEKKNNINNRAISPNSCFHYFSVLLLKYNSAVYLCCLHYGFTHIHTTLSFTKCNAGYYRISGICLLCPGNKIKTMTGDKSQCDEDTACDGITKIPNHNHTACGRFPCFSTVLSDLIQTLVKPVIFV